LPSSFSPSAAGLWAALAIFILYGSIHLGSRSEPVPPLPGISIPDIAQNVLLYVPFGTLAVLSLQGHRSTTTVRVGVIALAAAYSALMESLQLYSASRIASALDVVANVAGASIGVAIAGVVRRFIIRTMLMLRPTGLFDTRARFALLFLLAAIGAVAWSPFDITLDVSTLSERTRPVRQDPWLQPGGHELAIHAVSYFVFAVTVAACLPRLRRRAPLVAFVVAVAAAIVIDLGQLAMGSRPIGLAALLSQAAGAGLGAGAVWFTSLPGKPWYADA
jgi:VanZ family protein